MTASALPNSSAHTSSEVLRRARLEGYPGGKSALY